MAAPRVSVVVPTYDNARDITATIDSILAQTYPDFELVVSDHGSTDGTWDLLQCYTDPRVRLLRTPPGGGAPSNWKAVTEAANGEYLKLVCGDDLLAPDCLAAQVAALDADPEVVLVASRRRLLDARGRTVIAARGLAGLTGVVEGRTAVRRSVLTGANIFGEPACLLFRRSALDAAGGWDGRDPFVIDQATACQVALLGKVHAIPAVLAGFRLSATQLSVDLIDRQAREVVALHHRLAAAHPGLLTRIELAVADLRARLTALLRRLAYLVLARRMRPAREPSR